MFNTNVQASIICHILRCLRHNRKRFGIDRLTSARFCYCFFSSTPRPDIALGILLLQQAHFTRYLLNCNQHRCCNWTRQHHRSHTEWAEPWPKICVFRVLEAILVKLEFGSSFKCCEEAISIMTHHGTSRLSRLLLPEFFPNARKTIRTRLMRNFDPRS